MEKSNKRGKIPQSDWPLIMARYEAGETLASIARTYDCSPPAISYVVSKSRARQPARDNSAMGSSGTESQLIKAIASELARASSGRQSRHGAAVGRTAGAHIAGQGTEGRAEAMSIDSDTAAAPAPPPPGNGRDHQMTRGTNGLRREGLAEPGPHPSPAPASGATGNGRPSPADAGRRANCRVGTGQRPTAPSPLLRGEPDTRHRLHLPLGNGTASHNGSDDLKFPSSARSVADDSRPAQAHTVGLPYSAPSRSEGAEFPEAGSSAVPPFPPTGTEAVSRKEGTGAFIDHELRARVDNDIATFLAAFDAALVQDTQENRSALRDATDRLLRAGARTRIELERLEARVPLTAHDRGSDPADAWRYR